MLTSRMGAALEKPLPSRGGGGGGPGAPPGGQGSGGGGGGHSAPPDEQGGGGGGGGPPADLAVVPGGGGGACGMFEVRVETRGWALGAIGTEGGESDVRVAVETAVVGLTVELTTVAVVVRIGGPGTGGGGVGGDLTSFCTWRPAAK